MDWRKTRVICDACHDQYDVATLLKVLGSLYAESLSSDHITTFD